MELLRRSQLNTDHRDYKPMYSDRHYNIHNRKLHKMLAKTSWYEESILIKKTKWRQ